MWVVNAYMLTFGGFLLLGGRLGDMYGPRALFLLGITFFTVASLACGLANTQELLIIARAVQGVGGAVVSAVSLSLIMNMFTEGAERAKAMGVYGFVCAGGGSIGVLLGGVLTSALNWHWIFLVNLPIGVAVYALCIVLLPKAARRLAERRLDVAGAVTVTSSLMLAVYAIVNGNEAGWTSAQTLGLLGAALVLLGSCFSSWKRACATPLMPLGLFKLRNLDYREHRRCAVGGGDVRVVLHLRAVFAARAWIRPAAGGARVPAREYHHGGVFARPVREDRHALRYSQAAGCWAGAGRGLGLRCSRARRSMGNVVTDVLPSMILLGAGRRHRRSIRCCSPR